MELLCLLLEKEKERKNMTIPSYEFISLGKKKKKKASNLSFPYLFFVLIFWATKHARFCKAGQA